VREGVSIRAACWRQRGSTLPQAAIFRERSTSRLRVVSHSLERSSSDDLCESRSCLAKRRVSLRLSFQDQVSERRFEQCDCSGSYGLLYSLEKKPTLAVASGAWGVTTRRQVLPSPVIHQKQILARQHWADLSTRPCKLPLSPHALRVHHLHPAVGP